MSAEQGPAKRQCFERLPCHTVIVSTFGDVRPEESVADELADWLIDQGKSVTSYFVLPGFGWNPFFLAKYRYLFEDDVKSADGTKILYEKGDLSRQYVKEIIPHTRWLRTVACEVMFLIGHGGERRVDMTPPQPSYLVFNNNAYVSGDGKALVGNSPESTRIWSCSQYKEQHEDETYDIYNKWPDGITLADVVCRSELVFLLSCHGEMIMEEYAAEADDRHRPDFVVFSMSEPAHDISFYTFLALLTTAAEQRPKDAPVLYWNQAARVHVCQVLLWVKEYGSDDHDVFWQWLKDFGIILPGRENRVNPEAFRIKGGLHTYALTYDKAQGKSDKQILLEEMRSLTLMFWDDDADQFDKFTYQRETDLLEGLRNGTKEFDTYNHAHAHAQTPSGLFMNALLEQMRGLYAHAGSAGI
jgi:hypothetical protein